jgi:hypothetical protein
MTPHCDVVGYLRLGGPCQGEDGGNIDLRNVGTLPHHNAVSHPRRRRNEPLCYVPVRLHNRLKTHTRLPSCVTCNVTSVTRLTQGIADRQRNTNVRR